ncbi:MAG: hypothetical protein KF751_22305 [Nitrospira sp.]|nr:hypothetical protein [Nitrospira sp.]
MALPPLIRFGTSTWTYEGWQGQVYLKKYAKTTFAQEYLIMGSIGFRPLQEHEPIDLHHVPRLESPRTDIELTTH